MRRILLFLVLYLAVNTATYAQSALDYAVIGAGVTDIVTTQRLLSQCNRCSELNPVMRGVIRSRTASIGLSVGLTSGVLYVANHTDDKTGRIIKWATFGLRAAMTARNLYLLRTQ